MAFKDTTNRDIEIGANLRLARRKRGMTQADLAEHLGISYQQLQKYETGANKISASRLEMISNILQIDIAQFFMSKKESSELEEEPSLHAFDRSSERLLKLYRRISSEELRNLLLHSANSFAKESPLVR